MGTWLARGFLWILASALVLFTAALAWAVTTFGDGWYLLLAAFCYMVPLPLWYFLADRRRGESIPRRHTRL
ncbi:hypothetical protein ABZ471_40510 [Streptomyces sp. NPDC005728]|uniref:hypothetical protein n=1 Tax=Streptomyces sp. NPDC005728 TaxID=3157054 RepID=UPI0033FAB661